MDNDFAPIGGYFELELSQKREFHSKAIRLNTARSCLEYILRLRDYKKLWIPYYTCSSILEPINRLGISYCYYRVGDNLEPVCFPELKDGEGFLYTNYYGLKHDCIEKFADKYGNRLIVDNSQAFYDIPLSDIDTFYSARKFFGVPDGAYLYVNDVLDYNFDYDYSYERVAHLLKRIDLGAESGYDDFHKSEASLSNQPMLKMSKLTQSILMSIDYEKSAFIRKNNYSVLEKALGRSNLLNLSLGGNVPMVYPYKTKDIGLRRKLINNKIFVAKYWPNVKDESLFPNEVEMTNSILPLPIDQRYGGQEISRIIEMVME